MTGLSAYAPLLAALIALLIGLTVGKAWERYKLKDGKWIDRHLEDRDVAYMGDDVVDLAVLARAGLSAAPADAVQEVRSRAHWVSGANAGSGAARELIELVLKAQNLWEDVIAGYLNEPSVTRTTPS